MVGYTGLREISTNILERGKAFRVNRNMRGCILEVKPKGREWELTLYSFTSLLILTWGLKHS